MTRKSPLRRRVGRVSYYLHHGSWYLYYRDVAGVQRLGLLALLLRPMAGWVFDEVQCAVVELAGQADVWAASAGAVGPFIQGLLFLISRRRLCTLI